MPSVGTRINNNNNNSNGYERDPLASFAKNFREVAMDIMQESGIDIFSEPQKAMMVNSANEAMKNFFIEGVADIYRPDMEHGLISANQYQELLEDAEEMYLNDREAILEYAAPGTFNPVIGMTFPIHKNIMLNTVFDKGGIPKVVALQPRFTLSMEQRYLVTPDGTQIDFFTEQHKMSEAIDATAPFYELEIPLPMDPTYDVLAAIGATNKDNISIEHWISAVQTEVYLLTGQKNPETGVPATSDGLVNCWVPTHLTFAPAYGEYDRQLMDGISVATLEGGEVVNTPRVLGGYMDTKNNKFVINSMDSKITAIKLKVRIDTSSAMLETCQVSWGIKTDIVEIPEAVPINVPISPEEVKDIGALYNTNQLTKIMSLIKTVLGNYKDDKIKSKLDESFVTMAETSKVSGTFDFAPRNSYALDHIEWRQKTFMDALDTYVTQMLQVLNDPNMTITVYGRPDLIRKITPTQYDFQSPASAGGVDVDFVKTVVTSDKRVYQFISSDKLRDNNNLIVLLCPRNTERIIYRIYDYQTYVSNEIRNMNNYALPAIHAFERWLFKEYQPVQGRIQILNPTGLRYEFENKDPVGTTDYNDFTSNKPYSEVPPTP